MVRYQITASVDADRVLTEEEMDQLSLELGAMLSERAKDTDDPWTTLDWTLKIARVYREETP